MTNIVEERGELLGFVIHESFEVQQQKFINGLRKDSLAAGAIPNPHAKLNVPKAKLLAYVTHMMFQRGLPQGWGKHV